MRRFSFYVERLEDRVNPAPIPVLNSLPGAPADIYLDFDGEGSTTPYDTDGNPSDYSASEVADITRCWGQIATYFAMFNVNVTTAFNSAKPKVWHMSGNNISGGYSYVNVFPNNEPESFNQSSDARGRLSGIAHEVGHNFGLSHQSAFNSLGVETADYISAIEPLRGFLMGVDFSGTVKKFSIGHTSNASSLQDDINVMAGDLDNYGGDGFRNDDVGNTIATATALSVNGAVQTGQAIIERLTDIDVFSFNSPGGRVAITVAPFVPSGLDAVLEIRDAANNRLGVADTALNGQTLTMTLPAGTFYAFITSKGNYADLGKYDVIVTEGAPDGFQTTNIGPQWYTGRTAYDATTQTWSVTGSGSDIGGTGDAFQYAYRYLSGNGSITARVTGMENTNTNAKAGVMIRESLDANSRHVSSFMKYGQGSQMVWRSSTGGSSSTSGGSATTFTPRWVRLNKTGNTIQAQWSSNGTTWTTLNTTTVNVGSSFYVGLAVTSREDEETNQTDDLQDATFTNVTITGFTDPLAVTDAALPAPANMAAALGTGNGVSVSWNAVTGATGYSIERSQDGLTYATIATTTSALTYGDANPLGSQRYWYRVRATGPLGRSAASNAVEIVNRPSAVRNLEFTSLSTTQIVLDWLDTDGETGAKIERSTDGVAWTQIGTVAKNVPSYTASGLTTGTQYHFRVTPTSSLGDGPAVTGTGFTRLPSVSTTAFGTITSTSVQINWNDIAGETGYRIERSSDGSTWTTAGTVGAGMTTFTNSGLSPETEYYFRVIGTASGTESASGGNVVMCGTPPTTPIASPWISADIGVSASQKGMTSLTGGTFKVISGGADIWGTSDNFRFTYQTLVGNGVITARVASVEDTGAWAKIGVMIRESLNANSRHSHVFVSPDNSVNMQSRGSNGGSSSSTGSLAATVTAPYWVRMKRIGNVLTSYASPDGVVWTQVGTITLSNLAQTVYIGLSADANSSSTLNTSTYSNVTVNKVAVQGVVIDDGTVQRSKVRSLTVTFSGLVTLPANPVNAFSVVRSGGSSQAFAIDLSGSTATQTVAKLNFTSTLADGNYTLTVFGNQVTDASGFGLGVMPANSTTLFHRLFGDSNGDRTIDASDMSAFGNAFGVTNPQSAYDFNSDGYVDAGDFAEFGNRFGITI